MNDHLEIRNLTRGKLPSLPLLDIKNKILGKDYSLSLVFIGETRSRKLNREFRKKDKSTDVLSFPLSKNEGEIFITPKVAEKEMKTFGKNKKQMLGFLFIHGLLHLEGMEHGSKMKEAEKKFLKIFKL